MHLLHKVFLYKELDNSGRLRLQNNGGGEDTHTAGMESFLPSVYENLGNNGKRR